MREVLSRVQRKPALAYTTVLTVLTRLFEQDLVVRHKQGKAYYYEARMSREQWMGERAARELALCGGPPDQAVLTAFLDSAERVDPDLLDRLSILIAARRGGRSG